MLTAYWHSQAIYVAAKLGIADLLEAGPRTSADLAAATKTHHDFLHRVLRALASIEIFAEDAHGRFTLTPIAELLKTNAPGSQRALAIMMGEEHYHAWGRLLEAVKTGDNAFESIYGRACFDFLTANPEQGQIFDAAMQAINGRETGAVLQAYDFSGINVLADVGGGNGSNLIAILQQYPQMRGILFDLPEVIERARPLVEATSLSSRCRLLSGSFFEAIPGGADAILMRHIIHDWDDDKSRTILKNCRAALPLDGRLLVVESVIPAGNAPSFAKFLDLTMFLIPGGRERTESEYRQLYASAGFELSRVVTTWLEACVVEGRPRP
jgi:hypothetical protein